MRHAPCLVVTIRRRTELPLEIVETPPATAPSADHPRRARPGHCLVCTRPSEDSVCDACKALIRAEAAYHLQQDEKAGR
jgi:hypothetical protein